MSSATQTVSSFIKKINDEYATGTATEHSYRPALKELFEALLPNLSVQNEPKRSAAGAPDFIIADSCGVAQAYVEAKDVDDRDLDGKDPKRHKEQFDRYKEAFENIIFTDGLDFHLYREGAFVDSVRIAEVKGGKIVPVEAKDAPDGLAALVGMLIPSSPIRLASAEKLAERMASRAKLLAASLRSVITHDDGSIGHQALKSYYMEFKKILLPDLDEAEFADIYAQTIAYGMFAARLSDTLPDTFTRARAATLIPKTNPFLRNIFNMIAGNDIDSRYSWIIDSIAQLFAGADMDKIMRVYHGQGFHDPLMHFYEDFLAAYDKVTKKQKGVWYTPSAVVGFIVRSVDELLQTDFGLPRGLADNSLLTRPKKNGEIFNDGRPRHKVQILDPATGTGTFLAEVIRQIHAKFTGDAGAWPGYVRQHLIPRLIGFEVLMAPYVIAHMKMNLTLEETGFDVSTLGENERIRIYLTNSLVESNGDPRYSLSFGLTQEGTQANEVKADAPIMVMLGNPPYNGSSSNKGKWILGLLDDYKNEPGGEQKLDEKNIKWLSDDYVKFIRLAQDHIERTGYGIVAFITPHGFIDGPTFRGMRWHLLKSFDKIYCLDLHGNARLKEKTPDGRKDENVFDIMQGVSINIFVRSNGASDDLGRVFYADMWGERKHKYEFLNEHSVDSVKWAESHVSSSNGFCFGKSESALLETWSKMPKITDAFLKSNTGIVTKRDTIAYQEFKEMIKAVVKDLIDLDTQTFTTKYKLPPDSGDWKLANAKANAIRFGYDDKYFNLCLRRPFDKKWTYFTGKTKGFLARPTFDISKHMLYENVSIIVSRQGGEAEQSIWCTVFCSDRPSDLNLFRRGGGNIFPLFLYRHESDSADSKDYFPEPRRANLDPEMMKHFAEPSGMTYDPTTPDEPIDKSGDGGTIFTPMDFWHYTYAVLHSNIYRTKFKQFLDADFPRIPAPKSAEWFWSLVPLGAHLKDLHLMRGAESWSTGIRFPASGSNVVETPRLSDGKVYINSEQFFESVSEAAWNFFIGGYQPAQKWLKDRKGKTLTYDDIEHYKGILHAIDRTIAIMAEIDGCFDDR